MLKKILGRIDGGWPVQLLSTPNSSPKKKIPAQMLKSLRIYNNGGN
jgi:hypothetical protein